LDDKMFGAPAQIKVESGGKDLDQAGEKGYRRSIYLMQRRSTPLTMLEVFDSPLPLLTPNCLKRGESNVSSQALQLMNGEQVLESARYLAARIIDAVGETPRKQIERLYLAVLTRSPTEAELELTERTLATAREDWSVYLKQRAPAEPVAYKTNHM